MMTIQKVLMLSLGLALLSSCSTTSTVAPVEKIQVTTTPLEKHIPIQARPRGLQLSKPHFYVVTPANYEDLKKKLGGDKGVVFYAIGQEDYKKILGNQAELLRYIKQSNAIIVYYENNLK